MSKMSDHGDEERLSGGEEQEEQEQEEQEQEEQEQEAQEHEVNGEENGEENEEAEIEYNEAFQGAGQELGIEIWRIENFEPVRRDPKTYGQFHTGDAYIVLSTRENKYKKMEWDIHFWLGKECSPDESGAAAFLTVELDDSLNGLPIQHREVQGHESKQFLSYFKKGIKYLEGGVASGFRDVDAIEHVKRLFRCRGKHTVRVEQVEVMCASLNQQDVFILDDGPHVYVWIGPKSSRIERIKGMEAARSIRDDEKAGRAHIHVIEEDWDTNKEFFRALGSKDPVIRSAALEEDEDQVRKEGSEVILYRIFEGDGEKSGGYGEVATRPLTKSLLLSEYCYFLEAGAAGGVFLWTGKECSNEFKKTVWNHVQKFIDNRGYPSWLTVTRVIDGGESPLFKQYFEEWDEAYIPMPEQESNVAEQDYEGVDGAELHESSPKIEHHMPDDGTGQVKVWRIKDFEILPVNPKAYGVFFGGDCYVIQYDYGDDEHIIYFWQGLKSSSDEKGASALHAMKLDDDLGGKAIQIRVVMNKEPAHFLKIFDNHIVVFMGGHVSGFRDVSDNDEYQPHECNMFHVRSDSQESVKAYQVISRAASLNSNDVFLIIDPRKVFVWYGKYCQENEKEMARAMLKHISPDKGEPVFVEEGTEPLQFWNILGGEEPYSTGPKKESTLRIPPRLFHCSNASGKFVVEEVQGFDQEDLNEDDVMILDTYDEIFIWVGSGANDFEKKEAYKTAYSYLKSDPTARTEENTLIMVVRQGCEPPSFTGHFVPWDADKWNQGKTFAELVAELGEENSGITLLREEAEKYFANYTYEELSRKFPPEGVDVRKKEMYLTDEDFEEIFRMSKEDFYKLPEWKRVNLKKEVHLF